MAEKYNDKYRIASARFANWNYRWDASYFITICTKNRVCYFGRITNHVMHLSEEGKFATEFWKEIPCHFPFVILNEFVVMPNHVHGILIIDNKNGNNVGHNGRGNVGNNVANNVETLQCNVSTGNGNGHKNENETGDDNLDNGKNEFMASISPKPGSISTVIRSYKSIVSKHAHQINPLFDWQPRFHDHIIRDEASFIRIQNYILNNVKNWKEDKFF